VAERVLEVNGERWAVAPAGRVTQYVKDEFGLRFTRLEPGPKQERLVRYSPLGSKSRESSLAELSEYQLLELFRVSQPASTTPEHGYKP
jgi:hypothetical protein